MVCVFFVLSAILVFLGYLLPYLILRDIPHFSPKVTQVPHKSGVPLLLTLKIMHTRNKVS